jgi:hypothetical protein
VHPEKFTLKPTQELEFVGFIINCLTMLVRLSASKSTKVQTACLNLLDSKHITIRDMAHVIGLLVSSLPAVQFGELYYRKLEVNKSNALRQNKGEFDASGSQSELLCWIKNLHHSHRSLVISKPDLVLTTDASLLGWGAVFDKQETGGQWSSVENKFHIKRIFFCMSRNTRSKLMRIIYHLRL